jgi:basic membrane protein A and related proteins
MTTRRPSPKRHPERLLLVLPVAALIVAAVAVWTVATAPQTVPTPRPSVTASSAANGSQAPTAAPPTDARATATPDPNLSPRPVKSIVLVAAIGEDTDGTPSNLAWQAVQEAGEGQGAKVSRVQPLTRADLTSGIANAADEGATIVVAVGPEATQAIVAAGAAYSDTTFLLLGAPVPGGAAANVHGIVFDEAEAGYLAGFVAASVTISGKVGFVADLQTDTSSGNFAAGFVNGTKEAQPAAEGSVAYAGRIGDPRRGGVAANSLLGGGADVIAAMSGIAGDGALRTACPKAKVVAVDTDADLILPELKNCLVVSVLFRYDVVTSNAIAAYAGGENLPRTILGDVANGGIGLSGFHVEVTQDVQQRISVVLDVLAAGPPRPTITGGDGAASPSTKP